MHVSKVLRLDTLRCIPTSTHSTHRYMPNLAYTMGTRSLRTRTVAIPSYRTVHCQISYGSGTSTRTRTYVFFWVLSRK
jgi:hypothetical protein